MRAAGIGSKVHCVTKPGGASGHLGVALSKALRKFVDLGELLGVGGSVSGRGSASAHRLVVAQKLGRVSGVGRAGWGPADLEELDEDETRPQESGPDAAAPPTLC